MYKVLRIIFSLLAAAAAAAAIFVFVFADWKWGLITVAACVVFAVAMLLCRNAQVREELKKNPPPPVGDFITGKVSADSAIEKASTEDKDGKNEK